jgi:hypothetical protein
LSRTLILNSTSLTRSCSVRTTQVTT